MVRQLGTQTRDPVITSIVEDLEAKRLLDTATHAEQKEVDKASVPVMQNDQPISVDLPEDNQQRAQEVADNQQRAQEVAHNQQQLVDVVADNQGPARGLSDSQQPAPDEVDNLLVDRETSDDQLSKKLSADPQSAPEVLDYKRHTAHDVSDNHKLTRQLSDDLQTGINLHDKHEDERQQDEASQVDRNRDLLQNHRLTTDDEENVRQPTDDVRRVDEQTSREAKGSSGLTRPWLLPSDLQRLTASSSRGSWDQRQPQQQTAAATATGQRSQQQQLPASSGSHPYLLSRPQPPANQQQPFWYQQQLPQHQQQLPQDQQQLPQHQQLLPQHQQQLPQHQQQSQQPNRKAF